MKVLKAYRLCNTIVKWDYNYTNANGYCKMDKKFYVNPIYSLHARNEKGFHIWYSVFNMLPYNDWMGVHSRNGFNRDFYMGSETWKPTTINNAAYDYYKMCESTGVLKPITNLRICMADFSSTPMIRRLLGCVEWSSNSGSMNSFINVFLGPISFALMNTILRLAPDVFIDRASAHSASFYNTVSHELAHVSHYRQVGNGYWIDYVNYIMTYMGYGSIGCRNSGVCGVGEMWGYAMGNIQQNERYNTNFTSGWWFKPKILQELIEEGILTKREVFNCLTSDVTSHADLKAKLIAAYPNKAGHIIEKFSQNGF